MKKNILATVLLSSILLPVFTTSASAADVGTASTKGTVTFEKVDGNEGGGVIEPGTEDKDENEIDPGPGGDGGSTTGPLRLEFVPNFKFGTVKLKTGETTHGAIYQEYAKVNDPTAEVKAMPQFVQVTDERGSAGKWDVKVSATTFAPATGVTADQPALANTKIVLKEQKFFNTVGDFVPGATATTDLVEGFTADSAIPTDGSSIQILATKAGATTDGSKTSLVFNNAYVPLADGATSPYVIGERNDGVMLKKANGDKVLTGVNYESTLTWTLSDGI